MLHISDANANQYNSTGQDWLSALTQDQRKSIPVIANIKLHHYTKAIVHHLVML